MSKPKLAQRIDGRKPRLSPLPDFLDRNGLKPLDYLIEVLHGASGMPTPIVVGGHIYIETDSETRWRSGTISGAILRLGKVVNTGGWPHGRR